ncbi:HAMP domain-containing histidine kinase, partial [Patescibacteria group bacterium]|nr:HAMP domain-containing histidine kinase [Patescibacteria group bacterium]
KRQTKEISSKNKKLEQMVAEKTIFSQLINHQLRTPLSVLMNYLSFWENDTYENYNQEKQEEFKNRIIRAARKLDSVTKDLLNLFEAEDRKSHSLEKISFSKLLTSMVDNFETRFSERGLVLQQEIEKEVYVSADMAMLQEALRNIFDNAFRYASEKSTIKLTFASNADKMAVLEIKNSVSGPISIDEKRLMSRFERGENAREVNPDGSGLGLYIVKEVIEKMGGNFSVELSDREFSAKVLLMTR